MKPRFVKIRYAREFPFSVEEAFEWLTDYQDDDPMRTDAVQKRRHVISRTSERVLMDADLEFGGVVSSMRVEVRLAPPDRYSAAFVKGRLRGSTFEYHLTPTTTGCRLAIVHRVRVARVKSWVRLLLGRAVVWREIDAMWDGFAASMAREIPRSGARPASAPAA